MTELTLWLLDTNIISYSLRHPQSEVSQRIQSLSAQLPNQLCTSVIVECELWFGARKSGSQSLAKKIETMLHFIAPRPLDHAVVESYAATRAALERMGTPIGPNDTLIAAHALALGATLVTDNEAEFRRVPGLQVENWLR